MGENPKVGGRKGFHKGDPEVELKVKVPVIQRWRRHPRPSVRKGFHKGDPEVELKVKVPVMKRWVIILSWSYLSAAVTNASNQFNNTIYLYI